MDARRPTPRQLDALCAIIRHIDVHGVCPTHRELGEALEITIASAGALIGELRARGLVSDRPGKTRACDPTEYGTRAVITLQSR